MREERDAAVAREAAARRAGQEETRWSLQQWPAITSQAASAVQEANAARRARATAEAQLEKAKARLQRPRPAPSRPAAPSAS